MSLGGRVAPLGEVTELITSGSRGWRNRLGRGSGKFILAGCVQDGHLDLSRAPRVDAPDDKEARRSRVSAGDVLVTIVGEVGRVAAVRTEPGEAYVSQSVALVRPRDVDPRYLEFYLRSPELGQRYFAEKQYGVGRGHLLLRHIAELPIAVPPREVQLRLVAELEARLAVCDALASSLETNLRRVTALRHAVMQDAFRGSSSEA